MTEPQNYVWCVINRLTGIAVRIFYDEPKALKFMATNEDFAIIRMLVE